MVSYQVLQGGLLPGKCTDPDTPPEGSRVVEKPEVAHRAGGRGREGGDGPTKELADAEGLSLYDDTIRRTLSPPGITSVILGLKRPE